MTSRRFLALRKREQAKYTKWYFENMYWVEDFPGKKHYRTFNYSDPTHKKRFKYLTKVLTTHFKFNTVLDTGCGMGHIVRNLLGLGYKVKGVEVSKDAIKFYMPDLEKRGLVILAGVEKLPFRDSQFDLVFSSDVMEHIPKFDIQVSISELIRVCKRYLVLTINLDHPYKYHPTILSRKIWETMFLSTGRLKHLKDLQQRIENKTKKQYNEYDWFVFEKLPVSLVARN